MSFQDTQTPAQSVVSSSPAPTTRTSKSSSALPVLVGVLAFLAPVGIILGSVCGTGLCRSSVDRSVDSALSSGSTCALLGCLLRNLDTGEEVSLQRQATNAVVLESDMDYSVLCSTSDDTIYADFFFDGDVHRENTKPYWMNSNSGEDISPVKYLSNNRGRARRTFTVSLGTDELSACSTTTFILVDS